jgi:hypothetical protein
MMSSIPIAKVAVMESSVRSRERLRESRNFGSARPKKTQIPSRARAMEESRIENERGMAETNA